MNDSVEKKELLKSTAAISAETEKLINTFLEDKFNKWIKIVGIGSIFVLVTLLITIGSAMLYGINNAYLTAEQSVRSMHERRLDSSFKIIDDTRVSAEIARRRMEEIKELAESVIKVPNPDGFKKILDLAKEEPTAKKISDVLSLAPSITSLLQLQKICILHFPNTRVDAVPVPSASTRDTCQRLREALYGNIGDIRIEYGCVSVAAVSRDGRFPPPGIECGW